MIRQTPSAPAASLLARLRPTTASAIHLALPVIFFAYAGAANLGFLVHEAPAMPGKESVSLASILQGDAAKTVETLYKDQLPLRADAIGLVGATRYNLFKSGHNGVVVGRDNWLFTDEEFAPVSDRQMAEAVAEIIRIRDRLREAGSELVLVPLPAKADLYRDHLPRMSGGEGLKAGYDGFLGRLSEAGILAVDARAAMVAGMTGAQVFLSTDTHWTPAGASLVATATARTMHQAGLDVPRQDIVAGPAEPVNLWGDLTRFIAPSDYAAYAGLRQESLQKFQAEIAPDAAAGDLFGASDAIAVALVGTSYSANENWGFASYLRVALSSDVLNVASQGQGPGVPMMHFLASDTLKDTPPRVVIWEFPIRYLPSDHLWHDKGDAESAGQPVHGSAQDA